MSHISCTRTRAGPSGVYYLWHTSSYLRGMGHPSVLASPRGACFHHLPGLPGAIAGLGLDQLEP